MGDRWLSCARPLWFALVALSAFAPSAHAHEVSVRVIAEDGAPEVAFLDDVDAVIGRLHAFYEDALGLQFGKDLVLSITVIEDRATYLARAERAGLGHAERTWGFYSGPTGGMVWRGADRALAQSVLVHEISHDLLARAGRRVPPWLNEGLAEFVRGFRIQGNAIWLVPDPTLVDRLRRGVGGWRPTARLVLTSDASTWAAVGAAAGARPDYDHGSMLVAFLLSTPEGTATLRALLRASDRPLPPDACLRVVEASYHGGLARLESDWSAWWSGKPASVQLPIRSAQANLAPPPSCSGILIRRGDVTECQR